ncbi:chemotaxis protein CheW [Thauera linaloolentis]|uniref:CheW protein n=1 Tax=Thauera linaloolentis (strain DSM 12138 / JCM 21573 / CCUG 41526 / CIP 105981 / IAM 15112 / NBRC 102519 / 47Lol) TaxID=1123367 RepID=N6ZB70_THAL4|nr:chemotaxis protein CheW [Thauera linaloolentis]ENO89409.1 CheW protein [Thauera linaloolentis 47Lol = DSM 12138]MCM8564367.1 chemotaxis protein CheW [Thauera linaloolentis]
MARRSSLREFQERLARRLAEARTADRRGLLGFQAGSENWLIDLAEAGEILPPPPLATVPLTRPWYRGVANVRGTLYSVVDLAQFHGEPPTPASGRARLLLAGTRLGIHCALLVTGSVGLRSADDFEADPGDEARPWVARRLRDAQGHPWRQLDAARLLASPHILDAGLE